MISRTRRFFACIGIAVCAVLPSSWAVAQDASDTLQFPRTIVGDGGTVVFHTPQIDSWTEYSSVEARVAVAVTPSGEEVAIYGVAEFTADTDPNLEQRIVAVENIEISVTSFSVEDNERRELLDSIVRSTSKNNTHYVPLDVMLTYISPDSNVPTEEGLSHQPPPIFYSSTPAVLLMVDGESILSPIGDTRLEYVVNTNWDLFQYKKKEWYLRHEDRWLKNKEDDLDGDWRWDNYLPGDFKDLPDDGNWDEVKSFIPPVKDDSDEPTIFVSNRPAELIVTNGTSIYRDIADTGLQYLIHTESDVFRYEYTIYYLVSGRWFSASGLAGPWTHVTELPEAFALIPDGHEKAHVLAAIAGTEEARLAVLEASIPRKATISRDAGTKVNALFQGDPVFEPIPGTEMQRAVNSYDEIILLGGVYYLCENAVWYRSESLDGPWMVADTIPAAIYSIPPSSPSYYVTHVHVYESDEASVSTGYTSGYIGVNIGYGVVMYGSGWYYPPYYGYPGYPFYFPYPYSYGASSWYNPKTGMYGRSGSIYGPYGGYGRAASYNPETGAYARGGAVWDHNEIAGRGVAYNPRTGDGIATHRYANENGAWGESLITHNDKWMKTQSEWDGNTRRTEFETSEGGKGVSQRGDDSNSFIGQSGSGDVYAGKDGNVYRRDESGWQQHGEDGWAPVEVPDERAAQIDQTRSDVNDRKDESGRAGGSSPESRQEMRSTLDSRGFAKSYGSGDARWSNQTYDSSRTRDRYDTNRQSELNRNYDARYGGYQRYENRNRANRQATRSVPRRRR